MDRKALGNFVKPGVFLSILGLVHREHELLSFFLSRLCFGQTCFLISTELNSHQHGIINPAKVTFISFHHFAKGVNGGQVSGNRD